MRKSVLLLAMAFTTFLMGASDFLSYSSSVSAGDSDGEWPVVGQNRKNHSNQREEKLIRPDNVMHLEKKWQFDVLSGIGVNGLGVSGQPTITDGVAYFADASGFIYAVDADDGELEWSTEIPGTQFATSPTLTEDFLYIAESEDLLQGTPGAAGRIFGLDRDDGHIVWEALLDTSTIPSVVGVPINHFSYGGDTTVVGARVIVGVASVENVLPPGDNAARGSVVAYDRFTGAELWRFFTTDDQSLEMPEFGGGAGVWSSPAIDTKNKLLFIGTGQAYECPPSFDTCPPDSFEPGALASPFTDSLLAIDYRTGELIWHKQFTQDDVWGVNTGFQGLDHDVGAHPNLFSVRARLQGEEKAKKHDLVGVGDKGGDYYILKRGRDQGPNVAILATLNLDPGGHIGGIQSTAAFDKGVLYIASHAKIVDGQRVATSIFDVFALPSAAFHSTKIVAVDVRRLLEGEEEKSYTLWEIEEDVVEGEQIPGLTTAPLTIANGVIYHASSTGYIRALDSASGIELFKDTPLTFEHPNPAFGTVSVPLLGGATIVDGRIVIAVGTSFLGFPSNQPSAVVSYGLPGASED